MSRKLSSGKLYKSNLKSALSSNFRSGQEDISLVEGSAIEITSGCRIYGRTNISNTAKEKYSEDFKNKYLLLLKTVEELRSEQRKQKEVISKQTNELKSYKEKNKKFELLYQNCDEKISSLDKTLKERDETIKELRLSISTLKKASNDNQNKKDESLNLLKSSHNEEISALKSKYDADMTILRKENEDLTKKRLTLVEIVQEKSVCIENLKQQAKEYLNRNSTERQNQIIELVKELKRVSEEADTVKIALKKLKTTVECQKCSFYQEKFKESTKELFKKEQICQELVGVCSKMESQLKQSDELSKILAKIEMSS